MKAILIDNEDVPALCKCCQDLQHLYLNLSRFPFIENRVVRRITHSCCKSEVKRVKKNPDNWADSSLQYKIIKACQVYSFYQYFIKLTHNYSHLQLV